MALTVVLVTEVLAEPMLGEFCSSLGPTSASPEPSLAVRLRELGPRGLTGVRGIFWWVCSFEHRDDGSQFILMLQLVISLGVCRSGIATIGDEYRTYMKRTGRLLPRIKQSSG